MYRAGIDKANVINNCSYKRFIRKQKLIYLLKLKYVFYIVTYEQK